MSVRRTTIVLLVLSVASLSACGGTVDRSCDDVRRYQLAVAGKRVETPDDLDDLQKLKERPLPEASPRPPRPDGSPCLDLPPSVLSTKDQDKE